MKTKILYSTNSRPGKSLDNLKQQLDDALKEGWVPQGGINLTHTVNGVNNFVTASVLTVKEK